MATLFLHEASPLTCHPTPDAEGSEKNSTPQRHSGHTKKLTLTCTGFITLPARPAARIGGQIGKRKDG